MLKKITTDLSEFSFYFTVLPVPPGDRDTVIYENTKLLLGPNLEWIGIGLANTSPEQILWANDVSVCQVRTQESYLDYYKGQLVGVEVNLWIENRDINLSKVLG